jgi:hypothetical protein
MRSVSVFLCRFAALGFILLNPVWMNAEEMLVTRFGGDLWILQDSSGAPIQKKLAVDIGLFKFSRSGHFILKEDETHTWYRGSIDASLNVKMELLRSVPDDPFDVAISEDGRKVAWVTSRSDELLDEHIHELIIQEYDGNQMTLLRHITTTGVFWDPAWSPDGTRLAFYFGPPGAEASDGFMLMLLDVNNPGTRPVSLTPPSVGYAMNPSRPAPIWSPDGKFIIFEACYSPEGWFHGGSGYILSLDDRQFITGNLAGAWDPSGKHFYTFKYRKGQDGLPDRRIAVEMDVYRNREKRLIEDLRIPDGSVEQLEISPSAEKIAYVLNQAYVGVPVSAQRTIRGPLSGDTFLFIYDSVTQKTVSFGPGWFHYSAWIIPAEAGKEAKANKPSQSAKATSVPITKLQFPGKDDKAVRLVNTVDKIRTAEIAKNGIAISIEDVEAITRFFLEDGSYRMNFLDPGKEKESLHDKTRKIVEAWLLFRKVIGIDFLTGDTAASFDIRELLKRERDWWRTKINSHRKLIDSDVTDEQILTLLTYKFELSAAKEEFLSKYFAKKADR